MQKIIKYLKEFTKNRRTIRIGVLAAIVIASLFWRFYNYPNRWILNQDDARDVIIAGYSIEHKVLPLLGPTSSAGSFSFGPIYYWVVMIFKMLLPGLINGPWIGFTFLSVITAVLMFIAAEQSGGIIFGGVVGLLTAFSTGGIIYSSSVTNPILSGFFSFVTLLLALRILNKEKFIDWLFLGMAVGISVNSHFQSVGLIVFLVLLFLFSKLPLKKRLVNLMGGAGGVTLTFLPLILFDIKNKFVWARSVSEYILHGQDKFYLPVRWLTDLGVFWPRKVGEIIGGYPLLGYFVLGLAGVLLLLTLLKKERVSKDVVVVIVAFLIQVILIRYYKGPRDNIYMIFVYPLVIYLTGWMVVRLIKISKLFGGGVLILILIIAAYFNIRAVSAETQTAKIIALGNEILVEDYDSIGLYSYGSSRMLSLPLYYLLERKGVLSGEPETILIACDSFFQPVDDCGLIGRTHKGKITEVAESQGYRVYRVNSSSINELEDLSLRQMNGQNIFNELYLNYPDLIK